MKKTTIILISVLVVLALIIGFTFKRNILPVQTPGPTTAATYMCDGGKAISASFANNQALLALSDGRSVTLTHTTSADGARYANEDESFVFWSKGDNAFITESDSVTYQNCVAGTNVPVGGGMSTFTDSGHTFSFQYPSQFSVSGGDGSYSEGWINENTDHTLGLVLARLSIPKSFEPGTNFSEATIQVGTSSDPNAVSACTMFTNGNNIQKSTVTIGGISYTRFAYSDAGAGNRYDTVSYRALRNSQCYAIEYTVHSTNIGNYDPSMGIKEFDEPKIESILDGVVRSFRFL